MARLNVARSNWARYKLLSEELPPAESRTLHDEGGDGRGKSRSGMATSSHEVQGIPIAEQLRTLAEELDRQGRPELVEAMMARGRSEGLKALHDTADHFLRRVDAARETLRGIKHDAVAPYRVAILKILKAVETAADVKFARRAGGAAMDDGEWLLAQRLVLLPEHYRTLSGDHGKTLNDLASEVAAAIAEPAAAPKVSRPARRGRSQ